MLLAVETDVLACINLVVVAVSGNTTGTKPGFGARFVGAFHVDINLTTIDADERSKRASVCDSPIALPRLSSFVYRPLELFSFAESMAITWSLFVINAVSFGRQPCFHHIWDGSGSILNTGSQD